MLIPFGVKEKDMQTAQKIPRKSSGWSLERRAAHAAAIRRWAPWRQSTGPRTKAGKARSSRNAAKPEKKRDPMRLFDAALKKQRRYISDIKGFYGLGRRTVKNELLKLGKKARRKYFRALVEEGLRVILDFGAAAKAMAAAEEREAIMTIHPNGLEKAMLNG
jgi:hypothetical protein